MHDSKLNTLRTQSPRDRPLRNAGFKPIAKASSSLKRFFPGDEEDMDANSDAAMGSSSRITENNIPQSYDIPRPVTWKQSHNSVADESPSHRRHEPIARDASNYVAHPSTAHDPSHCLSDHEKVLSLSVSTVNLSQPLVDDEQPSPRIIDARDITEPRGSSHELDMRSPPPPEHQEVSSEAPASSSKDLYKIVSQVGEGTFGKVYKARNTITGTHVALKRIRMESERDGFPVTAMREIKLLQSLRHENVVRLYEMMVSTGMNLNFHPM